MFFEKKVDLHNRSGMVNFLAGHFRYNTMAGCDKSTSYAHCVKFDQLGLTREQSDKAWNFLDTEFWDEINYPIQEFASSMNGNYTIGTSSRSGGYLVLYHSYYEPSPHCSYCRSCGQKNLKNAFVPASNAESIVIAAVLGKSGGSLPAYQYLEMSEVASVDIFNEQKMLWIHKSKSLAAYTTLGNVCGRCGASGDRGRVNYTEIQYHLVARPARSIDHGEDFSDEDEWSLDALRDRVNLVLAFDRACDDIRGCFINLIENGAVIDEVTIAPQTRKIIQHSGVSI